MIRLLIVSDCHLRKTIYTQGKKLEGDAEYAISQIQNISKIAEPTAAIIAGDVFDRKTVNGEEIELANKLISAIKNERNIPIFAIQGNHDIGEKNILEEIAGVKSIHDKIETIENLTIGGLDWSHDTISRFREQNKDTALAAPPAPVADILVLHESMRPFSNFGDVNKLSVDDMPVETLCVVGDTHLPEFIKKTTDNGVKYVISPGCIYPTDKTEFLRESAAVWLVDVDKIDNRLCVEAHKIPLNVRSALDFSDLSVDKISDLLSNHPEDEEPLTPVIYINRDDIKSVQTLPNSGFFILAPVRKNVAGDTEDGATSLGMLNASFEDRLAAAVNALVDDKDSVELLTKELVYLYNSERLNEDLESMVEEKMK